jgi:hypothetical protein
MCKCVLPPPGDNPIAVNKYIISLPAVDVFKLGVTANEGIFHLSTDMLTVVIKMCEQCAGWVFKIRHSRSVEKPGEKKPVLIVKRKLTAVRVVGKCSTGICARFQQS